MIAFALIFYIVSIILACGTIRTIEGEEVSLDNSICPMGIIWPVALLVLVGYALAGLPQLTVTLIRGTND